MTDIIALLSSVFRVDKLNLAQICLRSDATMFAFVFSFLNVALSSFDSNPQSRTSISSMFNEETLKSFASNVKQSQWTIDGIDDAVDTVFNGAHLIGYFLQLITTLLFAWTLSICFRIFDRSVSTMTIFRAIAFTSIWSIISSFLAWKIKSGLAPLASTICWFLGWYLFTAVIAHLSNLSFFGAFVVMFVCSIIAAIEALILFLVFMVGIVFIVFFLLSFVKVDGEHSTNNHHHHRIK